MRRIPTTLHKRALRDPVVAFLLRGYRMTTVAPAQDPLWEGGKQRVSTAYFSVSKDKIVIPDGSVAYSPKYPDDWVDHPQALRVLDMLGYLSSSLIGPLTIEHFTLNKLFFVISTDAARKVIGGEKTEEDILDALDASYRLADTSG